MKERLRKINASIIVVGVIYLLLRMLYMLIPVKSVTLYGIFYIHEIIILMLAIVIRILFIDISIESKNNIDN